MRFEWDESKRRANIRRHGFDFVDVPHVFSGAVITFLDDRDDYPENRFLSLGLLKGMPVVVVHTETDEIIRIISVRKASRNEEKIYFEEIID